MALFSLIRSFLNRFSRFKGSDSASIEREPGVFRSDSELERSPRIRLGALDRLAFESESINLGPPMAIANISTSGVAFIRHDRAPAPAVGAQLKGKLYIGSTHYPVVVTVVHNSKAVTGCRFMASSASLRTEIERYFSAELAALSLSKVNPSILKPEEDGIPHWYRGRNNAELYFVESDSQVLRFYMAFMGFHIEGGRGKSTRLSVIMGDDPSVDENGDLKYKPSAVAVTATTLDAEVAQMAIKFLNQVPQLSTLQRQMIRSFIEGVQFS